MRGCLFKWMLFISCGASACCTYWNIKAEKGCLIWFNLFSGGSSCLLPVVSLCRQCLEGIICSNLRDNKSEVTRVVGRCFSLMFSSIFCFYCFDNQIKECHLSLDFWWRFRMQFWSLMKLWGELSLQWLEIWWNFVKLTKRILCMSTVTFSVWDKLFFMCQLIFMVTEHLKFFSIAK